MVWDVSTGVLVGTVLSRFVAYAPVSEPAIHLEHSCPEVYCNIQRSNIGAPGFSVICLLYFFMHVGSIFLKICYTVCVMAELQFRITLLHGASGIRNHQLICFRRGKAVINHCWFMWRVAIDWNEQNIIETAKLYYALVIHVQHCLTGYVSDYTNYSLVKVYK